MPKQAHPTKPAGTKAKTKKSTTPPTGKSIKVRLDYRTIIVLKHISALPVWLKKYPQAKVMAA